MGAHQTLEEGKIDRRPGWSRLDWIALLAVTAGAALLRLPGLSRPVGFVFDEIWYARNACRYVIGTPECGIDQLASRAHPPLGNWMIGAGIKAFGYDEFGWRISAAVVGTVTVALLFLLTWQLLRQASPTARTFGAFTAAALLAGDFLHVVQSRIGMLDASVTLFAVAAILFAVHDRDRPRPADWDRRPSGVLSALTMHRPWRLLAGMALGAAVAVKWSGAYVALAVIGLTAAWEIAARRSAGPDGQSRSWTSATWLAIREELPRSLVLLGVVPVAVYLAAYIGRMPGELIGRHGRRARSGVASGTTSRRCSPSIRRSRAATRTSHRHGPGCCSDAQWPTTSTPPTATARSWPSATR
jgi:dolichyl-phosphate-mannose--protein O-mannosyl transferase